MPLLSTPVNRETILCMHESLVMSCPAILTIVNPCSIGAISFF